MATNYNTKLLEITNSFIEFPRVKVNTYDVNEETTCIDTAILLKRNKFKQFFVVPVFSLMSLLAFPVILYWKKTVQRDWLYSRATSFDTATHIYIEGRGKSKFIGFTVRFF